MGFHKRRGISGMVERVFHSVNSILGEENRSWSSLLFISVQLTVTYSLLSPLFSEALLSDVLYMCYFLIGRNRVTLNFYLQDLIHHIKQLLLPVFVFPQTVFLCMF